MLPRKPEVRRAGRAAYRWFIFDWGAIFCAGRLYWGVKKVRPNQKRRDDRRAKAIADSCTPCDAPLVRFVCIFWTRILSHVYKIIFLSTLQRISKNTHPFVCVPSSTLIIYIRLGVFCLPLNINEALAFKVRLEGKQWTCVSSQIRILTN